MPERRFYTVGGTVQASGGVYIDRESDSELLDNCRRGDFSFVLTARQMGKSSLMVRTARQLAEERIDSVIIDLSQIGVQITEEEWYLGILTRIEDSLDLDTDVYGWWEEHHRMSSGQRFSHFFEKVVLKEHAGSLVVFFDEIDSTLSLPFTDDFFASIRSIFNARSGTPDFRRLVFVLVGVATPTDLISDPRRTPFNIGAHVDLKYFTPEEALPFARGFGVSDEKGRQLLNWIFKWTHGHPFLTQRLCAGVAASNPSRASEKDVDRIVRQLFFGANSEQDSNLRFVHDMLTRRAEDVTAVLMAYRQVLNGRKINDDRQSSTLSHLKLSGLIGSVNGRLAIQNPIYEHVFDREWLAGVWPEHWIKRVPPAVLGLVVASFLALLLLGALYAQSRQTRQAEQAAQRQVQANADLSRQIAVSDSLNTLLSHQSRAADSLRGIAETANDALRRQINISDSLRLIEVQSNRLLSEQVAVSESLRTRTQGINEQLQAQVTVSDSLAGELRTELTRTTTARLETLTLALANAAQRQVRLGNAALGALLARQAFQFSLGTEGAYLDAIYDALVGSLNALPGPDGAPAGGPIILPSQPAGVRTVAVDEVAGLFYVGMRDGTVRALDRDRPDVVTNEWPAHEGTVRAVGVRRDGRGLVSSGDDGSVRLWPAPTDRDPESTELIRYPGFALHVELSSDGASLITTSSDGDFDVWDLTSGARKWHHRLAGSVSVRAAAIDPGSNRLAFGADDGRIRIIDADGTPLTEWPAEQGRIHALAFNPSTGDLASGGDAPDVRIWRIAVDGRAELLHVLHGHEGLVSSLAYSADGAVLATGSYDHSIQIRSTHRPESNSIILQSHDMWVEDVAFFDGGARLISGGADRTVQLWNLDVEGLASSVCTILVDRELDAAEWNQFVGSDFDFGSNYRPCQPPPITSEQAQ